MICMRSSGRMLLTLSCSGRQGEEASKLRGNEAEIAGAERACPGQKLAPPRPLLYPGATTGQCYHPHFHSYKEATLLQTQHQIRKYPLL